MENSTYEEALKLFRAVLDERAKGGGGIKMSDAARACGYQPDQVRAMQRYADFPVDPDMDGNAYVLDGEQYEKLTKYLAMRDAEVPTTGLARKYGVSLDEVFELCERLGLPEPHQRPIRGRDPTVRSQGRRWYWYGSEYSEVERAFNEALNGEGVKKR